ncbi:hypothetical protein EJB05_27538, partial [Eragrostis curvula]
MTPSDNKRVDLVKLISEEGDNPKVITVWGTSGDVGQASIIREAYQHPDVRSKFPVRAWVRVMHPFSPKSFVLSLVNQFHATDGVEDLLEMENTDHQNLAPEFNGYVTKERCLIVLNDLTTIEEWDQIEKCFRNIKKGSRIVVMTGQVEVASLCAGPESQVSELKQLSADQTLYAFYVKGFQSGEDVKKPGSCSDGPTASTNDHTVVSGEIIEDRCKDTDELHKVVKKSISRIRTRAGGLEESQLIGREKEIAYLNNLISNRDNQQVQHRPEINIGLRLTPLFAYCVRSAPRCLRRHGQRPESQTPVLAAVIPYSATVHPAPPWLRCWLRHCYQRQKLGDRFEKCVFVTIMRPFKLVELLRSLAARLHEASSRKEELIESSASTKKTMATMGVEDLIVESGRLLGGKSCLIILDDLSSITEWDQISPVFRQMEKTSRIVVTTREEDIAKHCSGQHGKIHKLQVLEQEEARQLFSEKFASSQNPNKHASDRVPSLSAHTNKSNKEAEQYYLQEIFGEWRPFYISDKMRFLRVLDLEGTNGLVSHHLDHIGKLVHLRYLSLRGCDDIVLLPDSVGNLRQLQTLDIRDTYISVLPKTITKLRKLQYIHAARKSKNILGGDSESLTTRFFEFLGLCPVLCASCCVPSLLILGLNRRGTCTACCIAFATIMQGLEEDGGVMVPRGLRKLRDLHTLKDVHVGRGNVVLQDIERLTGLRKLGLTGINKKNGPAFCSALSSLSRLESLSVWSSAGKSGMCGCLDRISLPPANLQSLKLYGNLETLPEWIKELQHLVKLKLVGTRLSENDSVLKFLGSLPKLDILVLSRQWIEGDVLHFQSPQTENAFGNLRVLRLANNTTSYSDFMMKFDVGVMPKLELLQVQNLWIRGEFDISGLEVLPSINEVKFNVLVDIDDKRFQEASASKNLDKIWEEIDQEQKRKEGEYKNKIREQLDKNPNRPTWKRAARPTQFFVAISPARWRSLKAGLKCLPHRPDLAASYERRMRARQAATQGPFEANHGRGVRASGGASPQLCDLSLPPVYRHSAVHTLAVADLLQFAPFSTTAAREDEGPEVIAVWGTSGDIGQTSLIREAYEHPDVCSKFPVRAWVRVMHPFSLKGFIQSIVNQIYACSAKGLDDLLEAENIEQDIAKKFNGYVHNEHCLVVLNDLSTIEQWDQIKICFQNIKKGSRIVVSTTQVEVASLCAGQKSKASELKQLSADQTLYAFYVKASKNMKDSKKQAFSSDASTSANDRTVAPGDIIEDQLNDADGKKVVRKSITRIMTSAGALTQSQLIGREKQVAHIDQLLSKRDSHQVISVWGMGGVGKTTLVDCVYQSQKLSSKFDKCAFVTIMRPFDIVEFLDILVKRLNESSSKEEELIRSSKKTTTMGAESLTKELASLLEMKSCLIVLDDLWYTTEWDMIRPKFLQMERTSRIIVTTREEKIAKYCSDQPENIYNIDVLEYEVALDLFSEKVLDLEGTEGLVSYHLDHIGKLLHLRYLSLRGCDDILLLPDSLGNLRQLQTLDIRDTGIIALPKTITKLQKLQYINAAWKSEIVQDDHSESLTTRFFEFLGLCPRLCASCCVPSLLDMGLSRRGACTSACCIAFPAAMQGRLGIQSSVMVPRGLRKLRDLHTLKDVHVGRGNVNGPAFCSALSRLSRLESLSVRSSAGKPGMCGCLDMMSSPPANLQSLKLYGNLETLPEWIKELQHLVKLKLVGTRLSENHSALKFLGSLPKLDILVLSRQWIEGDVLHFQSPQTENAFGNLRVLRLANSTTPYSDFMMKFDVGVMPKLELLQLQNLWIGDEFDISGLEVLPSINEVQFSATYALDRKRVQGS